MTDWSSYATPTGRVFVATIGPDGLISGIGTCALDVLPDHLAAVPGAVPVMPDQAALFEHGSPFALANGAVVASVLPLAEVQKRKVASLRAACGAAITGGFGSTALGTAHTYPSGMTDQANLIGSVTASLLPGLAAGWTTPFWCADAGGAWAFLPHTAAQIQQVGADGKAMVVAAQARLGALVAAVSAATTADQVAAITW